jgi:hypothetical protein
LFGRLRTDYRYLDIGERWADYYANYDPYVDEDSNTTPDIEQLNEYVTPSDREYEENAQR